VALGVRVGISAGDVLERAGDYHGVQVVEAARLCAAAMGGQILASETVRCLVGSRGSHDFVPVGELTLKGLPPVATVALRWCDGAPAVAPARGMTGNLPVSVERSAGAGMEFRVLGSLEVGGEDGAVAIGGAKQRALLAVLLVHANSVVSADRLAD